MKNYIALIHKDPESDYGVSFPDFPGCVTAGISIDEARELASEALSMHIRGMLEDGDKIPEPSSFEAVIEDPDYSGAIAFIVIQAQVEDKAKRINITIPEQKLRFIDIAAKNRHMTRSAFLVYAAEEIIKHAHR